MSSLLRAPFWAPEMTPRAYLESLRLSLPGATWAPGGSEGFVLRDCDDAEARKLRRFLLYARGLSPTPTCIITKPERRCKHRVEQLGERAEHSDS